MNNDILNLIEQYKLIIENAPPGDPLAGPANVGREVGAPSAMQQQTAQAVQGAERAKIAAQPTDPTTALQKFQQQLQSIVSMPNDSNKGSQIIALKNEIQQPMETAIANATAELNHDPNDMQNPYVGSAEIKKEYSNIYLQLTKMSREVRNTIQETDPNMAAQLTDMFGENWSRLDNGLALIFECDTHHYIL